MKETVKDTNLKISRILHAGYIFQFEDCQIAFDPVFENPFSKNCYAYPDVSFDVESIKKLNLNAVFISHYHDDHCSLDSLKLLDKKIPIFLYCFHEELFSLIQQLGFINVCKLDINRSVKIQKFEIIVRKALEPDVDCIFEIKVADLKILNMVDSWMDLSTLDILSQNSPWDLVLWPFQTLREIEVLSPLRFKNINTEIPNDWIEQLNILKPRFVIPSSCQFIHENWSWYNSWLFPISYDDFTKKINLEIKNVKIARLNPGNSILLAKTGMDIAPPVSWVQPKGPQDIDYKFTTQMDPPTSADVAKNFPQLSEQQKKVVLDFCQRSLIDNYSKKKVEGDNFFFKKRIWKFIIYDNQGAQVVFMYQVYKNQLTLLPISNLSFSWLTEISAFKLYSAICYGETLTSLYLRVNDFVFDSDLEDELCNANILNDPLIQSLFDKNLFSFQKEQLKNIKLASS